MAKKSSGSLRDQLKAAGLVTGKQARKAENASHRQEVRRKKGVEVDEEQARLSAERAAKQARDRELNEARDRAAAEKALAAQVRQLITTNSQRGQGDVEYHFTDGTKVKKIYVSAANARELNKGYLAVVRADDGYDLVPEKVARKIMERRDDVVLYLYERGAEVVDEDDPYKDFPIPDDLDW